MSALALVRSAYTSALEAAGFAAYEQHREVADEDGTPHRKFILKFLGTRAHGDLQAGGTAIEVVRQMVLVMWWLAEGAESTIWGTVADDELLIDGVMLKQSNKPAGCRLIWSEGGGTNEEDDGRLIRGEYVYSVRVLETGTFT